MEELQEALKGKTDSSVVCVQHERDETLTQSCSKQLGASDNGLSVSSSDRRRKENVEFSLEEYLNLRRHSVGSLMEFTEERRNRHVLKRYSTPNLNEHYFCSVDDVQNPVSKRYDSFVLSPIEEYSETSTRTNSFRGSSECLKRTMSLSTCSFVPLTSKSEEEVAATLPKYQTFPRSTAECSLHDTFNLNERCRFPLSPRELDPFAYYQLHTADSQEELQEFLLLESACMSDSNKGTGFF